MTAPQAELLQCSEEERAEAVTHVAFSSFIQGAFFGFVAGACAIGLIVTEISR